MTDICCCCGRSGDEHNADAGALEGLHLNGVSLLFAATRASFVGILART